jgi:hypothetical protein
MSDRRPRFDPEELRGGEGAPASDAELASALAAARALEASVARDQVSPTDGFEDRVMAAIATEALPKAVVRPAGLVRGGRPAAFLAGVRDAWGVAMSGGRPLMVRAQAMSFVLLVVLATGSLTAVAAVGAAGILSGPTADPSMSPAPTTVVPTPSSVVPSTAPSIGPSPWPSPSDDDSAEPTESPEPGETPGAGPEDLSHSAEPTRTPKPTKTPRPSASPDESDEPDESDDPDETDEPDESDDPDESDKP